jgi:abortive infection bacteriophage resistance protein
MEGLSFGAVSRIYEKMRGQLRLPIAATFGLQHDVLKSWLHALTFVRNVCAHHCRVWKRVFTIRPQIPRKYREMWPSQAQALLYVQCGITWHMMKVIAPESSWARQLRELIDARPAISLASMGFPENW